MLENRQVIDSEWDEIEYGVKRESLYQRQVKAFEESERNEDYGFEFKKYNRGITSWNRTERNEITP